MERTSALSDTSLAALYVRLALTDDGNSIRLLDILPGKRSSRVEGMLRVVTLDSNPHFVALSYTWGGSSAGHKICLDKSHELEVTDNLYNALKRLRARFSVQTVWIDQICIDQSNERERSQQVAFMGNIYRKATCVDIWLGEPNMSPAFSLKSLRPQRLHSMFCKHAVERNDAWRAYRNAVRNRAKLIDSAVENTVPHWHDRSWVVQEAALARKTYIRAGGVRVLSTDQWMGMLNSCYT